MSGPSPQPGVRFGSFEVNPCSGELRKQGIRIKLHEKPLQVLLVLLEHPGEVVTRKEIQERLWPQDTFVEFENGLNNAISRLREALGDTVESPRFIETVPRHGYRFLAEVSHAVASSPANVSFRRWLLPILLGMGAALGLGVTLRFALPRPRAIQSLAVLPFRTLGAGASEEYFTDGMTDAVTTELAKVGVPKVISETSVAQFKDTKKSVPEIARALSVDAIVEGAVLREGDEVRITVQLIRGDTDRHIWAESYQRPVKDILALQNEIALGVARAIKLQLSSGAAAQQASRKPVNAQAYEAYLKGRYFMQKRDPSALRAKDYFEQAIQLDPGYAPAYAGLSDFYVLSLPPKEALPKAKEYAQKALQLDPNLADGHISLAYIYFYDDWDWNAAGEEFQRALSLAPGLAESHRWYAVYLAAMGRMTEAIGEAQRALDLDPLSISAHNGAAVAAISAGQYDRSIEEGRKIIELDPNDPRAYLDLAVGHLQKRMYQEALQDTEKGLDLSHRDPFVLSIAAHVYGRLGNLEQAGKLVDEMRVDSQKGFVPPFYFATALVGMGKQKEAIEALEEGYKAHDPNMVGLNSTAWFEALRADARFQDLVTRMHFPAGLTRASSKLPRSNLAFRKDGLLAGGLIRVFEPPAKFASRFLGVSFVSAVLGQVAEFVSDPMTQPVFSSIAVVVDEHGPAWQVGEHQAPITRGDVKVEIASRSEVFPMGHEEDAQGKDFGVHDANLFAQCLLLGGRRVENGVPVRARFGHKSSCCRSRFRASGACAASGLGATELCER